jgi:hypothetical protein
MKTLSIRFELAFLVGLGALIVLSLLDVWSTQQALAAGGYEMSPVGRYIVARGTWHMLGTKFLVAGFVYFLKRWPEIGLGTCWGLVAIHTVAVTSNIAQLKGWLTIG